MRSDGYVHIKLTDWGDIVHLLGFGSVFFDQVPGIKAMHDRIKEEVILNLETYSDQGRLF